jgi:hypothetical protein
MLAAERVRSLLALHGAVQSQPATDWSGPFQLPAEVEHYYRDVGPCDINIELPENPCYLPRLADLWSFQEGYRWRGRTGERLDDWLDEWLVVASLGGDPFIFHRGTGEILHVFHGAGEWKPEFIFDDLNSMAACLSELGSIWEQSGHNIWDDLWSPDCQMLPKYRAAANERICDLERASLKRSGSHSDGSSCGIPFLESDQ